MKPIAVVITKTGNTNTLFDGRTLELKLILKERGIPPMSLGHVLQEVCAGPSRRMSLVFRDDTSNKTQAVYWGCINTDETEEVVKKRFQMVLSGDLTSTVIQVMEKERSDQLWAVMQSIFEGKEADIDLEAFMKGMRP